MREPLRTRVAIAVLTLSLLGCESVPAQERSREGASSERMAHHFEQATQARDALVRADLPAARRAARALANADAPPALQPAHVEAMRGAARRVASSRDLDAAARDFGDVARACGACHQASRAEVEIPEMPPPAGDDLRERMQRHFWATDRLWEGLVLPDPARFAAGATELVDAPLFASTPATGQTVAPEARAIADTVRAQAREAQRASDDAARSRAYGELLGTCADCHRLVGAGGPAAPIAL